MTNPGVQHDSGVRHRPLYHHLRAGQGGVRDKHRAAGHQGQVKNDPQESPEAGLSLRRSILSLLCYLQLRLLAHNGSQILECLELF